MAKIRAVIIHPSGGPLDDTLHCVTSLREFESDIQIIVVDNGSGDDLLTPHLDGLNVKIIKTGKEVGFATASNCGLKESLKLGADYIFLLNNDVVFTEPVVSGLVLSLTADDVAAVAPLILNSDGSVIWGAGGRLNKSIARAEQLSELVANEPYPVDFLSGCAALFKTSSLEAVGLFEEDYFFYYEDVDLSVRLRKAGYRLLVVPGVSVNHKGGAASGGNTSDFSLFHTIRSNLIFVRKNYGPLRRLLPFVYLALLSLKILSNNLVRFSSMATLLGKAWREGLKI